MTWSRAEQLIIRKTERNEDHQKCDSHTALQHQSPLERRRKERIKCEIWIRSKQKKIKAWAVPSISGFSSYFLNIAWATSWCEWVYSFADVDLQSEEVCWDAWICLCRTASKGTTSADTSSLTFSGQLSTHAGHSDQQHVGAKQMLEDTIAGLGILDFSVQVWRLIADVCVLVTCISVQNNLPVSATWITLISQCFVYIYKRM